MSENLPPPLHDLDARLRAQRERARASKGGDRPAELAPRTEMGRAMRVGVELVVGLAVGGAIGWGLDRWWGTTPVMLILFFFLGAAAGMLNVFRAAREMTRPEPEGGGERDGRR